MSMVTALQVQAHRDRHFRLDCHPHRTRALLLHQSREFGRLLRPTLVSRMRLRASTAQGQQHESRFRMEETRDALCTE
eukprot:23525-Chlamydomonas_euryale.AAC.9